MFLVGLSESIGATTYAVCSSGCDYTSIQAVNLTRGPYIQLPTTNSVTIVWNTDRNGNSEVEYGLTSSLGNQTINFTNVIQHVVTLKNLSMDTTYYYRVKSNGTALSNITTFHTNKDETNPEFSFVVFGDSGTGGQDQYDIANRIKAISPELGLHSGDVIYPGGEAENFDPNYFVPYNYILKNICIFPSIGNHDIVTNNGAPYLDAFFLPRNNPENTERYYSFDYGNAHFIALDVVSSPYDNGSAQYNWLESDLANTNKTWKFAFFHYPPYSSSFHGSDLNVRRELSPLFEKYNVDMVFSGHDHDYERTIPINGVVYVVTGGGGFTLYNNGSSWFTALSVKVYHVIRINISNDTLNLQAIKKDGTIFDTYTLSKSPDITPPLITIISPENKTYNTSSIALAFSTDDLSGVDWTGYSLDGGEIITSGNTTITDLSDDQHYVTVYSNDTLGNMGSVTVYFTANALPDIVIYTDKTNYRAGDTMYVGMNLSNLDGAVTVAIGIWVDLPSGGKYWVLKELDVIIPEGFDYSNPTWLDITLPSISPGDYAWFGTLAIHPENEIISESIAPWTFSNRATKSNGIKGFEKKLERASVDIDFED